MLNHIANLNSNTFKDNYEGMYEYNEETEGLEMTDMFPMRIEEQLNEESKTDLFAPPKCLKSGLNKYSFYKMNVQDSSSSVVIPTKSTVYDYEMFGFGTNKKVVLYN